MYPSNQGRFEYSLSIKGCCPPVVSMIAKTRKPFIGCLKGGFKGGDDSGSLHSLILGML